MATNPRNTDDDVPRRRSLRAARGFVAGGSSASTRAESMRTAAEEDEIDDLVDPELMRDRVLDMAADRSPLPPARMLPLNAPENNQPPLSNGGIYSPREMLNRAARSGSAAYSREFRLSMLHRLLMRNTPLTEIAEQFQVSVSTIEKDRAELRQRLREKAKSMDINEFIGEQTGVYDEIAALALRTASSDAPTPMRLAGLRTALAANADRTRMLTSTGVMDALRYRRAATNDELSDVQLLMQRTGELMDNFMFPEEEQEPEAPVAPKRVKRSRTRNGFQAFSMDDRDASNSSYETVEL